MKTENKFQPVFIEHVEALFPGCIILKNDEQYIQGIPDLTILYRDKYAVFEVKRSAREMERPGPNQEFYIAQIATMGGIAGFVYPENEAEVLDALQHAFEPRR